MVSPVPNLPIQRSHALDAERSRFHHQPAWADGSFWAPELVQDRGHFFLYYVAHKRGGPLCGREAILDEIEWTPDGWPSVNRGTGPGRGLKDHTILPATDFSDDFDEPFLGPSWQWPVNTHPRTQTGDHQLSLGVPEPDPPSPVRSAMIAVPRPTSVLYEATVTLKSQFPVDSESMWSGLAVVGDPFHTIGLGCRANRLILWHRAGDRQDERWSLESGSGPCWLR